MLRETLTKDPNTVYGGLLTVLMRLVFLLCAEDRGLMSPDSIYAENYSVSKLFEQLRGKTSSVIPSRASRVGRDRDKPRLVVTILNPNKPRDRSHFERFAAYHESFHRSVEATSVTPFSPRALDRTLAAAVALARHGHKPMTRPGGADAIVTERTNLAFVPEALGRRAEMHKAGDPQDQAALRQNVRTRTISLLETWERVSVEQQAQTVRMKYYQREGDESAFLLRDYLAEELKTLPPSHWKAKFRAKEHADVEPAVNISVQGPGQQNLDEESD